MPTIKTCLNCCQSYNVKSSNIKKSKFCSRKCMDEFRANNDWGKPKPTRPVVHCAYCGKSKRVPISSFIHQQHFFCNLHCRGQFQTQNSLLNVECGFCGKMFLAKRGDIKKRKTLYNNLYCSRSCAAKSRRNRIEVTCETCGKIYSKPPSLANRRNFCSKECLIRGEPRNDYGTNWEKQRQKALSRDDNRCQICFVHQFELETPLHVHHIKKFREFGDCLKANILSNLITLCPTCHGKIEPPW